MKQTQLLEGKTQNKADAGGRYADLDPDKLRGGYYTSPAVAEWLCRWAIRSDNDSVLEPSCGDGIFVEAAIRRLLHLHATDDVIAKSVTAVEVLEAEAQKTRKKALSVIPSGVKVHAKDFFSWWQTSKQRFDAVIGNPPFIRYQSFPEAYRDLAMEIMRSLGLTPNRLTNIWVPFVVASVAALKAGGRLALVLPAELLQVTYAAQLRSFLTDYFQTVHVVTCNELFFERAEQEVILLMCEGRLSTPVSGNQCLVKFAEFTCVDDIISSDPFKVLQRTESKTVCHDREKWLKYFLSEVEIQLMRELRDSGCVANLSRHANVDVGVVTGKNEFFVLSQEQVLDLGLQNYTTPIVSRSAHLKGSLIDKKEWKKLSSAGDRVHLFSADKPKTRLPKALAKYIVEAEEKSLHTSYKCSIRNPWYAVPSVWVPEGFVFRQIYDFPRIVLNKAGATSTDTIHRLSCKSTKPERVIANTYTWLTAASAEIEGRSYGGGVLELEPTEAERLLMPASLNGALPLQECDQLTRQGRLSDVLEHNARVVLMEHIGLSAKECSILRNIWHKMRDRRMARRPKRREQ